MLLAFVFFWQGPSFPFKKYSKKTKFSLFKENWLFFFKKTSVLEKRKGTLARTRLGLLGLLVLWERGSWMRSVAGPMGPTGVRGP